MYNLENQRFGHLVAIKRVPVGKWLCKCDCGNEKEVYTRDLIKGLTKSCGCIKAGFYNCDLTGQRFGLLTVIGRIKDNNWLCRCDCGSEIVASDYRLTTGHNKSCGCLQKKAVSADITGQRFGKLTALHPTERSVKHSVVWLFKCDCGREIEAPSESVKWRNRVSCSYCRLESQKKQALMMEKNCGHIEGTQVSLILSKKLNINNTSGYKGVHWVKAKKKWLAIIQFKNIIYRLGLFKKIEDAIKARADAEERLHGPFLEWYEEYKKQK